MYNNQSNVFASQLGATHANVDATHSVTNLPLDNLNKDPNPVVIRKKPAPVQYTQNIAVRFLKPPPLPPQGRVIIKQEPDIILPPPPPLVIRKYHRLAKVSPNAAPTQPFVNMGQQGYGGNLALAANTNPANGVPFLDHGPNGFGPFSTPHVGLNMPPTSNFSYNYSNNGLENLSQGGSTPFNF
jgi:hypothetical protein